MQDRLNFHRRSRLEFHGAKVTSDARVVAPRLPELLKIQGNPDERAWAEHLRFENLTFEHTMIVPDRCHTPEGGQAACTVPGAIVMEGARHCAIENCRLAHLDGYGIELGDGCRGIRLVGNDITDMAGGGIRQGGSNAKGAICRRTGHNRITDCPGAVGPAFRRDDAGGLLADSGKGAGHHALSSRAWAGELRVPDRAVLGSRPRTEPREVRMQRA